MSSLVEFIVYDIMLNSIYYTLGKLIFGDEFQSKHRSISFAKKVVIAITSMILTMSLAVGLLWAFATLFSVYKTNKI